MFVEWRAKRLAKPSLRLQSLGISFEQLTADLAPLQARTETSEWVGCVDYVFEDNDYKLIASVESGVVVAYVHDTDIYRATQPQVVRKLNDFLDFYGAEGTEHELDFVLDNGFGLLFRSKNSRVRAAYSHVADIFSVSLSRLERAESDEQH
jgi:hypothetical protein